MISISRLLTLSSLIYHFTWTEYRIEYFEIGISTRNFSWRLCFIESQRASRPRQRKPAESCQLWCSAMLEAIRSSLRLPGRIMSRSRSLRRHSPQMGHLILWSTREEGKNNQILRLKADRVHRLSASSCSRDQRSRISDPGSWSTTPQHPKPEAVRKQALRSVCQMQILDLDFPLMCPGTGCPVRCHVNFRPRFWKIKLSDNLWMTVLLRKRKNTRKVLHLKYN